MRKWLKRTSWSAPTRAHLEAVLTELERVATDTARVEREEGEAAQRTVEAEQRGVPGIYVYALPHYLRYPYDIDSGHTLFKVGHSSVDVYTRVGQGRTTALPEDPVLLRVYATSERPSHEEEHHFHDWLEAADHGRNRSSRAGREWFLTSMKFLDRIAAQRGLEIQVVSDLDVGAD